MENETKLKIVLEKYEWCNLWWDNTHSATEKHVMLIGDSITNGYRPLVAGLLKCPVDMLATSKAIDNKNFFAELKYVITSHEYNYSVIHFNNGLHGFHVTIEDYERQYESIILHVQSMTDAKLILTLSTPVTVINSPGKLFDEKNDIIIARNKCVVNLAKKYGLEIDNLYEPMYNRAEYRSNDGFHYNEIGQDIQAKQVAEIIKKYW